jgi:hypothetical protein
VWQKRQPCNREHHREVHTVAPRTSCYEEERTDVEQREGRPHDSKDNGGGVRDSADGLNATELFHVLLKRSAFLRGHLLRLCLERRVSGFLLYLGLHWSCNDRFADD